MPEMLKPTSAMGAGLGKSVALITDGRFLRLAWFCCRACYTRSFDGGGIALVKNGDTITIDAVKTRLILKFLTKSLHQERQIGYNPNQKIKKGVLLKYIRSVSSASTGCVTDK
jgi:dihydroxy-acid dehydratase